MNWDDFKEKAAYEVQREIDKQTRPLNYHWTIGDGREYETKKQAEVMSLINANGYLFLDTVLSSKKMARAVDELIARGIIESIESDRDGLLKFNVKPVIRLSQYNKKLPSINDMKMIDDIISDT